MTSVLPVLLVMMLITALLTAAVVHAFRKYRAVKRLRTFGVKTTGECSSLRMHEGSATVRFSYLLPDGTRHWAESAPSSYVSVTPGDLVAVIYDPLSPTTAELVSNLGWANRFYKLVLICVTPILIPFLLLTVGGVLTLVM